MLQVLVITKQYIGGEPLFNDIEIRVGDHEETAGGARALDQNQLCKYIPPSPLLGTTEHDFACDNGPLDGKLTLKLHLFEKIILHVVKLGLENTAAIYLTAWIIDI